MNIVAINKYIFTPRILQRADKVTIFYSIIGQPPHRYFISIIKLNALKNNYVTTTYVNTVIRIYGTSVPALSSNTTRLMHVHVNITNIPIPQQVLDGCKNTTLCVDILFIGNAI